MVTSVALAAAAPPVVVGLAVGVRLHAAISDSMQTHAAAASTEEPLPGPLSWDGFLFDRDFLLGNKGNMP
jgi:hypothetical protein